MCQHLWGLIQQDIHEKMSMMMPDGKQSLARHLVCHSLSTPTFPEHIGSHMAKEIKEYVRYIFSVYQPPIIFAKIIRT